MGISNPTHLSSGCDRCTSFTFNGATFTADSASAFVGAGQNLRPGGSGITVFHTPISIAAGGTVAIIGTSDQVLAPFATTTEIPVLTFGGSTYIVDAASAFVIDGQTLTKGGTVMVQGTTLSFNTRGTDVVIGSSTQILGTATITGSEEPTITLEGQIYTEDVAGNFLIIGGQTLTSGGVVCIWDAYFFRAVWHRRGCRNLDRASGT